jgi:carbamoyltransferase
MMGLTLAVNAGIGSSVGVFRDGVPVFCVEEERFNRVKNWMGIPEQALHHVATQGIAPPEAVDQVALVNLRDPRMNRSSFYAMYDEAFRHAAGDIPLWSRLDPRRAVSRAIDGCRRLKRDLERRRVGNSPLDAAVGTPHHADERFLASLGYRAETMTRVEHHHCHAAAAYYGLAPHLNEDYLVFTLDGGGDFDTSTVWRGKNGRLEKLSASHCYSIGNIYSAVTHFLGFTPHEHEYKLMGVAPYVHEKYFRAYLDFFGRYLRLTADGTAFENPHRLTHEQFMRQLLGHIRRYRFDNLSAGLQAFTEEIVIQWIRAAVAHHGIRRILCSGGVFMNVKLNQRLSQLPEIEWIDVFPSCGDESNIFGAAWHVINRGADRQVGLLSRYTLGTSPEGGLAHAVRAFAADIRAETVADASQSVCRLLLDGKIVARCSGPMEFGARALGNRSILANPRDLATVNKINRAIKNRDFWMPFAPAVLWERADQVVHVPPALSAHGSPYMMFTFDTRADRRADMICGLHQADFTARAQTLTRERDPELHRIVELFYRHTGVPAVLNTSFNLHGHPIVENAAQAVDVLLKSELDALVIGNTLMQRRTSDVALPAAVA